MQKQSTRDNIFTYIKEHENVRPAELLDSVHVGEAMLYRHLKALLEDGFIVKIGESPRTFYVAADVDDASGASVVGASGEISSDISQLIEENFLQITPTGKRLEGVEAFVYWCNKRGFDIAKMAKQYKSMIDKYAKIRKAGLLDATAKIRKTFTSLTDGLCVDKVFYVDFYSLETFGKTKLGQMLLYAKQSQDKAAIMNIADTIKPKVEELIKTQKIDAVVYVPPTVKRNVQFMKILEKRLAIGLPKVSIIKVLGDVAVPQKTLKSLEDRVENANASFMIKDKTLNYNTVLIIDDAIGSGASINQIACKLKKMGMVKRIIGMAITGSLNNFDVISEV